jgi:membrane-associated protease RseP (regulator of RpoE activity)
MALNIVLLVATFITTLVSGALMSGVNPILHPERIWIGLQFSLPLLAILGVHEMGHYTAGRRHGVDVTLPYFIPFLPLPPNPGTMGAIIKIRSPFPDRNALMDIGAAGPMAGAMVAIPVLLVGLSLSHVQPVAGIGGGEFRLGDPLILKAAVRVMFGALPAGSDVMLHPVAYAGWIGLLVTMLNLIPSGQLDGGHVAYALFGGRYGQVARLIPFGLILMGFVNQVWFVWAGLLFVMGTRHPEPIDPDAPLTPGRRAIGFASFILFVLTFSPNPIS